MSELRKSRHDLELAQSPRRLLFLSLFLFFPLGETEEMRGEVNFHRLAILKHGCAAPAPPQLCFRCVTNGEQRPGFSRDTFLMMERHKRTVQTLKTRTHLDFDTSTRERVFVRTHESVFWVFPCKHAALVGASAGSLGGTRSQSCPRRPNRK